MQTDGSRCCRIECGASNFKIALTLKATANALFKRGEYHEANAVYEQALERAATVAYTKQFGGWRECGSCAACASGTFQECRQPTGINAPHSLSSNSFKHTGRPGIFDG